MLEAVNSVLLNAPLLRLSAEQASSAAVAASEASVAAAPQAPYISPYVYVDNNYNKAVLQIRDSDTGDVLDQYPSEETLAARQRQAQSEVQRSTPLKSSETSAQNASEVQAAVAAPQSNVYTETQRIASDTAPVPAPLTGGAQSVTSVPVAAIQASASTPSAPATIVLDA